MAAAAFARPTDRLIVALDVEREADARAVVDELAGLVTTFKVGLQLFSSAGPWFVRELSAAGHRIFLDLKFHDIPNTVAKAGVEAARLGVWMFNVHAAGGNEMMRRVVYEVGEVCAKESLSKPLIIGATVLTSSSGDALLETGIEEPVGQHALRLARLARNAGLDGVVASAQEAEMLHREFGDGFTLVTPGIRAENGTNDDQERVMTPADAIRAGSNYLVVGRPVIAAEDRRATVTQFLGEISKALDE
jgi:orotidine-5'-phosphate decarboxylase